MPHSSRDALGRPKFINLLQIRMPITAIVSVGHRASGILLFALIPLLVYLLSLSLQGPQQFAQVVAWFSSLPAKLLLFVIVWSGFHHLFTGIRYLTLDVGIGETVTAARRSAWLVLFAGLAAALLMGVLSL